MTEIVILTPEQVAARDAAEAAFVASLRAMAADSSDSEMQANARALLAARGITQ